MSEFLSASPYFGVALTLVMFLIAVYVNRRWPGALTTPLFLATILVVVFLTTFNIPYDAYNKGAQYITYFLVPVTVCFAVPVALAEKACAGNLAGDGNRGGGIGILCMYNMRAFGVGGYCRAQLGRHIGYNSDCNRHNREVRRCCRTDGIVCYCNGNTGRIGQ